MYKIIRLFIMLLISENLTGQMTPVTDHYILNPLSINPAFAGSRGALNIAAFYRRQWVGISGAPETATLALDAPFFKSKLGLGLIITNDKIGVTKETRFNTSYAYRIKTGRGNLSLGLGAGVITTNTAWSDLSVDDPGDEYYLINSRTFVVPDFSFGVYYSCRNYFAGLSIPKLLSYKFDFSRNRYTPLFEPDQYRYLFNAGYLFGFTPNLMFMPSALLTYSPGKKLLYDINAHFNLSNRFWFGFFYRNNRSVTGLFQFAVNYKLRVAYSYDYNFSSLGRYSNVSHEVMLRYEFRYKTKVVNQLIF